VTKSSRAGHVGGPQTRKPRLDELLTATSLLAVLECLDPVLSRAIAYMEAKIHLPLTLVEIAEYVGSSERHFSRRFREGTEQTPKKMLIILRH